MSNGTAHLASIFTPVIVGRGKTGLATLAKVRSDVARRDSKVAKSLFPVSVTDGEPRRGRGAEAPGTGDFRTSS